MEPVLKDIPRIKPVFGLETLYFLAMPVWLAPETLESVPDFFPQLLLDSRAEPELFQDYTMEFALAFEAEEFLLLDSLPLPPVVLLSSCSLLLAQPIFFKYIINIITEIYLSII